MDGSVYRHKEPTCPKEPIYIEEPKPTYTEEPQATCSKEPEATYSKEPDPKYIVESVPTCSKEQEPMYLTEPEPIYIIAPEPTYSKGPEPIYITEPEPIYIIEPEPTYSKEPEPIYITAPEPEPIYIIAPEPTYSKEPEPIYIIEPEPIYTQESQTTYTEEPQATCSKAPEPIYSKEPQPMYTIEPEPTRSNEQEPTCSNEPQPACSNEPEPTCTAGSKSRARPKKKTYTEATLRTALVKIQSKALTVKEAAKLYHIPATTIRFRLRINPTKKTAPCLRMSVTKEEEIIFKHHLMALNTIGIPVSFQDIQDVVKAYLDRKGMRFRDNKPDILWCKLFLERYEDLKEVIMSNEHPSKKKIAIDTTTVNDFFDRLQRDMDYMSPDNIYNIDECGFEHDPDKLNLLFKRTSRHPELDNNSTKSMYTVVFCGNAIGELIPPFFIFKDNPASGNYNSNTSSSPTGWIETNVFDQWLEEHFLPRIKDKPGKKILICDNMSAHVSVNALQMCVEHDIKFICPMANSSSLRPFDVEYYEYLQSAWRRVLDEWRETPTGQLSCWQSKSSGSAALALPKDILYELVNKTISLNETTAENIITGFKKCGIYPLSRYEVLQTILQQELEEYFEH